MLNKDLLRGLLVYHRDGDISKYERLQHYVKLLNHLLHPNAPEFAARVQAVYPNGDESLSEDWLAWYEVEFLEAWFDHMAHEMTPDGFMFCFGAVALDKLDGEWCGWMPIDPNDLDGVRGPRRISRYDFVYEAAPYSVLEPQT
jgi:hypothetical protein